MGVGPRPFGLRSAVAPKVVRDGVKNEKDINPNDSSGISWKEP